jgi:putative membrane protein insertion efficiency factor
MSPLGHLLTAPLRFYQRFISSWTPATCRFSPTCSQYAIDAIQTHGALRGTPLTLWRILRCHPFCKGGHDPVPTRRT